VFLSLQRSEGFGRGMAEALQLGVDVITTAYGGNTDFCTGPLAHPVR
jgi:glycosyltransferase involved in cell wall biosynthesis